jgi:hypothetical protein
LKGESGCSCCVHCCLLFIASVFSTQGHSSIQLLPVLLLLLLSLPAWCRTLSTGSTHVGAAVPSSTAKHGIDCILLLPLWCH